MSVRSADWRRDLDASTVTRSMAASAGWPVRIPGLTISAHPDSRRVDIARAALADAPVLLRGETGTGKELVKAANYSASSRREGPFVAVNIAAIAGSVGYPDGTSKRVAGCPGRLDSDIARAE